MDTTKIKPHLIVYAKGEGSRQGAPSLHVGTVEHVDSDKYIKLIKSDSADGQHHWLPLNWVESVDDQAVYLNKTQDEIMTGLMVYHCKSASS